MKTTFRILLVFGLMAAASPLAAQTYTYDVVGRLTRVIYADGKAVAYDYDEADNLVSVLPLTVPAAPEDLSITRDVPGQATLRWTDRAGNETGFAVQRRSDDNYDWQTVANLPASTTAHTDTGLADHVTYAYRIQALGSNGASALSPQQPATALIAGAQLANISNRAQVGTGADILIPGFVLQGTENKQMLIRAAGPALTEFGVNGVLEDPGLTVQMDGVQVAQNDDWQQAADADAISAAATAAGAFPLPVGGKDAAVLVDLAPGAYTAQVAGKNNTTGVALVEVYDTDPDNAATRLVNISGRAQVGIGGDILIPGIVVDGAGSNQYLIRAVGPTLTGLGVPGVLSDPILTVLQASTEMATNDNWENAPNAAAIAATASNIGAFQLDANSSDAALLISLEPGAYTIQVSGVNNATGVALVEVYEVQ